MIIGMNFSSVVAKVDEKKLGEKDIRVGCSPTIISLQKAEVLDMKDVIRAEFKFEAKYEPEVGEIVIEGSLLWRDHDAKKVLRLWEDDKKVEAKAGVGILNAIFRRCLSKAIVLAEDVRLPPPVQFPIVKAGEPDDEKKD